MVDMNVSKWKEGAADLADRVQRLLTSPSQEFARLAGEPQTLSALFAGWIAPLTLLMVAANVVSALLFGIPAGRDARFPPDLASLPMLAVPLWIEAAAMPFLSGAVIMAVSRMFGGINDYRQATRTAAFISTPGWLANMLGPGWQLDVFQFIPPLSLPLFVGAVWGIYLLSCGMPAMLKTPPSKTLFATGAAAAGLAVQWTLAFMVTYGIITSLMAGYIAAAD
jgi:hypothetical protein